MTNYIFINQAKAIEWKLTTNEAMIIDYLLRVPSWADRVTLDSKDFYWISRNKVIEDMPFITKKSDTIYRIFKALHEKGLIKYEKLGIKDAIHILPKMQLWHKTNRSDSSERSEINPTLLGNESESCSEINPTNKNININSLISISNRDIQKKSYKKWTAKEFAEDISRYKEKYTRSMLNDFYLYWIEPDSTGKMRFQLGRTWDTNLRLSRWSNNGYNKNEQVVTKRAL